MSPLISLAQLDSSVNPSKASVEKLIHGIQIGLFGLWGHQELKLTNNISLRSEVGFYNTLSIVNSEFIYHLIPNVILEPRWYYNLKRRHKKNKDIVANSANFLTIHSLLVPNFLYITNQENSVLNPTLSFIPSWGMRSRVGKTFSFEYGAGLGYMFVLQTTNMFLNPPTNGLAANLHLKFGLILPTKK